MARTFDMNVRKLRSPETNTEKVKTSFKCIYTFIYLRYEGKGFAILAT